MEVNGIWRVKISLCALNSMPLSKYRHATHDETAAKSASRTYNRVGTAHNPDNVEKARTMATRSRTTQHNANAAKSAVASMHPRGRNHNLSAIKEAINSPLRSSPSSTGGKKKPLKQTKKQKWSNNEHVVCLENEHGPDDRSNMNRCVIHISSGWMPYQLTYVIVPHDVCKTWPWDCCVICKYWFTQNTQH